MKLTLWCLGPGLLLVLLSALLEPHSGRHAPPTTLIQLGGSFLALGSLIVFPYWVFLFIRMCWRNFMAPHRIAEELRLARVARESGQTHEPDPDSGRIFGNLR